MNTIWITREIIFEEPVSQKLFDVVRKETIIPFLDELIDSSVLLNWYTSLTATESGMCPHYRIYIRVKEEDESFIKDMFDSFIDAEGLSYNVVDPSPPVDIKDSDIWSIQAGSEAALRLLRLFPYVSGRYGSVWGIALLRELLIPIRYQEAMRLHFIANNIGGTDIDYLKWAGEMFAGYKRMTDSWYGKWGKFGRLCDWAVVWFKELKRRR
uniref:Uncharacterized protein n=1 Tax=viral metagenome TaxID=1070528 RepID=A0A6H2A1S0_9ZZZZ